MNEVMKAILDRKSVRRFSDRPVEKELLEQIADAAMHTPSGQARKTWRFTFVSDKEVLERMIAAIAEATGFPKYTLYGAPVFVIPTNLRDNPFGIEDNSAAIMNMMTAAESLGLSTCWINQLKGRSDEACIRKVFDELGIPADHIAYGSMVLGYADPETAKGEYREKGEVAYI